MPRPTRFGLRFAPRAGFSVLIAIAITCSLPSVYDLDEVRNRRDHPAHRRGIRAFDHLVESLEAEALHDELVLLRRADRAAHVLDADRLCGFFLALARHHNSSSCL